MCRNRIGARGRCDVSVRGLYCHIVTANFDSNTISVLLSFARGGELGDVNCDGSVTPGDAQAAFDSFLGLSTPTCITNGDVCPFGGDGSITPGDAQGIFNTFLGISPSCG